MPSFVPHEFVLLRSADAGTRDTTWKLYVRSDGRPRLHARVVNTLCHSYALAVRYANREMVSFLRALGDHEVSGYSGGDARDPVWNVPQGPNVVRTPAGTPFVPPWSEYTESAAPFPATPAAESEARGAESRADPAATSLAHEIAARIVAGQERAAARRALLSTPRTRTPRAPRAIRAQPLAVVWSNAADGDGLEGMESVGVEFECFVPTRSATALDTFVRDGTNGRGVVEYDGSLHATARGIVAREYTFHATNFSDLQTFLATLYTHGATTNSTCGLHVHVRPKVKDLWVMGTRYYWDGFMSAYHSWARSGSKSPKFAERETSTYAPMREWSRTRIRNAFRSSRAEYVAINLSSLVKHDYRTVEHRILPAQASTTEATESLKWLLQTVGRLVSAERIPVTDAEVSLLLQIPRLTEWPEARADIAVRRTERSAEATRLPWVTADLEA